MPGKNPHLSPLEPRKQLLLAESEINRELMAGDVVAVAAGVRALTNRAKSLSAIGSSATALVAGLAAFQLGQPARNGVKPTWLQTFLKGANVVSNLWLAFGANGRDKREN